MLSIVAVCHGKICVKSNDGSINEIFKVCWHYILVLKTLAWMAYDEVENEAIIMKICSLFEGVLCLWRYGMCQLSNSHQRGKVIDQLLLCNLLFFSILNLLMLYAMSNLSHAAEVMYISVSPGFGVIYPMILEQGLQMTSTVAYINSLAM